MRITLLHPAHTSIGSRVPQENLPPYGLLCLGGPLIDAGHDVTLVNADLGPMPDDILLARVAASCPDAVLIGHSGSTSAHPTVVLLVAKLRSILPDVKIIYGGVWPTYHWEDILRDVPEIDAIVRGEGEATGVALMAALADGADLRGVNGSSLNERWADGLKTHLGIASAEFPNMFFLYGPQSPSGFSNGPSSIEVQADWLTDCLKYMRDNGLERIEAEYPAEKAWSEHCAEIVNATLFPKAKSWYMGDNVPGKTREVLNYPGGIGMYAQHCQASAADSYSGFKLA